MSATTKDLVNKFIKLDQQIKGKEGEVEDLKKERAALEALLLPRFQEGGIASMKSSSKVTVYLRRDLWAGAKDGDKASLYAAMRVLPETAPMVQETVNSQTFSAYVREKAREYFGEQLNTVEPGRLIEALPTELQGLVNVTEKFSLRATKS